MDYDPIGSLNAGLGLALFIGVILGPFWLAGWVRQLWLRFRGGAR